MHFFKVVSSCNFHYFRASRKRSKPDSSESENNTDDDAELEDIPRHATWEAEDPNQMHFLLPLKTKFGIVHQSAVLREQGTMSFTCIFNVHSALMA